MKILVTGGAGFLGRVIVRKLGDQGHEVLSFSRGPGGSRHIQGDVSDYEALKQAMKGCEAVFHTAAKVGMWGPYEDFYRVNVRGTENVLKACREWGIRYLVFTSSPSVVYHGEDSEGQNESLPYPAYFDAYYPQTKAIAEQLVMAANDASLKTVSLRPHLIWGPEDQQLLPQLFKKAQSGKLRLLGSGSKQVDCIYVDNAATAHVKAFNQLLLAPARVEGKTYFLSQGTPIPMAELIHQLLATGGFPPVTKQISPEIARFAAGILEKCYRFFGIQAEPPITLFLAKQLSTAHWYDISAARRDFGYQAEVSIAEGMKRLREWVSNADLI